MYLHPSLAFQLHIAMKLYPTFSLGVVVGKDWGTVEGIDHKPGQMEGKTGSGDRTD